LEASCDKKRKDKKRRERGNVPEHEGGFQREKQKRKKIVTGRGTGKNKIRGQGCQ